MIGQFGISLRIKIVFTVIIETKIHNFNRDNKSHLLWIFQISKNALRESVKSAFNGISSENKILLSITDREVNNAQEILLNIEAMSLDKMSDDGWKLQPVYRLMNKRI